MAGPTGNLFVVAAPSGGGKTSLTRALLEREPGILLSVSYTTRPPRPGEIDGFDYHFVIPDRFAALKSGRDVLLEIDWQGALQVRKLVTGSVHIFILPPSLTSLQERLVHRGQDDEETIARRLSAAREEMRHCVDFDYVIINQDFASAVADLAAIVRTSRLRSAQQCVRYGGLLAQLT